MKRTTAAGVASLACATLLTSPATASAAARPEIGDVQQVMDELAKDTAVVGVIGEMFYDGKRIGRGSAGSRLIGGKGGKIPSDSRYRAWSLTKGMTSAVISQLVEEGKLAFDDKLGDLLPWVVEKDLVLRADEITVDHLLKHTSGIPDFGGKLGLFDLTYHSPIDLLKTSRGLPREQDPGEKFSYSSTGYVLLGLIIEEKTRSSLDQAFAKRLWKPLGMTSTYLPAKPDHRIKGPHGHGYYPDEKGRLRDTDRQNATNAWAAGSVISTAKDLAAFQRAQAKNRPPQEQPGTCLASAPRGSGPGSLAQVFTTQDGRLQLAVNTTLKVANHTADGYADKVTQAAEKLLCSTPDIRG
ncbi:class A beta-lactamase-related serine hydrolase [Nonomuraea mesophila]|uniref:Class A beta-lactamase-related serine hydrolase n=1 Tax=Nonomuraea mesophila TaxID=2530382 RepID=A0A4V2Z971_9ACTN|nr:serine hydrolase domain-containing protein [Nonomuraea mesophila]TDE42559.1 class A beta-lactamase-related serine hydrolase [Nonomuraea mesophila]